MSILKKAKFTLTALAMVAACSMSASAAGRYNETKPLTSVRKATVIMGKQGNTYHKHQKIYASNGLAYFLYDPDCMNGMVGRIPTNHDANVTIDGVKYTLRNYAPKGGSVKYANVIKKVGTSVSKPSTTKTVAVTSVKMNRTSAALQAGSTLTLTATVAPSNATNKTVTWSSSNTSVATVSGGRVTAKKAGTVTITAKAGTKTTTCKITVKAKTVSKPVSTGTYRNVSSAYTILNTFRTTSSNQWCWNASNTAKVRINGLKALKRDASLENIAKLRAKEQWTQYYVNHKKTHTRPNGQEWYTAYPSRAHGENLAWGQTTEKMVITDPNYGWAETNMKYSGQGHRRNMLDTRFTRVGIACYTQDGKTCWAMCLGF